MAAAPGGRFGTSVAKPGPDQEQDPRYAKTDGKDEQSLSGGARASLAS